MPLPRQPYSATPALNDLGLGNMLSQQVAGETDEMRKKRMLEMQQRSAMGGLAATNALFPGGFGAGPY